MVICVNGRENTKVHVMGWRRDSLCRGGRWDVHRSRTKPATADAFHHRLKGRFAHQINLYIIPAFNPISNLITLDSRSFSSCYCQHLRAWRSSVPVTCIVGIHRSPSETVLARYLAPLAVTMLLPFAPPQAWGESRCWANLSAAIAGLVDDTGSARWRRYVRGRCLAASPVSCGDEIAQYLTRSSS